MPDSALARLDYEHYFLLLREGFPVLADYCVRDIAGAAIALDEANGLIADETVSSSCNKQGNSCAECDRALQIDRSGNRTCYSMAIYTPAGEYAGQLSAVVAVEAANEVKDLEDIAGRLLGTVASCIEKEYRLTIELDAMARELAGRYEELNLLYKSPDDEDEFEDYDCDIHNRLVEDYVDYLGVDLVALIFPEQGRIFYATGNEDPVRDPYDVIRLVSDTYLPNAGRHGKCLLINGFNDKARGEFGLDVPYKIIACPVLNARGEAEGLLICLNHIYRNDFYNSDRNLLTVMAAKVAKILNANYDALTGLSNQQVFNRMVGRALDTATSQGQFHCLLNIDLCKLLVVNDDLGREAGDAAIRNVGRLIKSKLRSTDSIAYLGEGRYGVLLEHCTLERGEEVAGELYSVVERNPLVWNGKTVDLNIAIGMALIEPHSKNVDEVLEAAEIARQSAKESGSNRIQTYRQNDLELVDRRRRMQWVTRIQEALRENRFRMYCQAIDPVTASSESYHFEVLLRLIDKQGEVFGPAQFIPPAEQFNLMQTIDRWVIDTTFRTMSEAGFARVACEGIVSINLSGQSLADRELPDYIFRKLVEYSIAPGCFCFEITETVAFRDTAAAIHTMSAIKKLGCFLSLDDFGTGLSSFSYLKELPVDYLKIDGSFVRIILEDRIAHAMVASINQIGHVMGLKTIAEYVENTAIAERLALMGIDYLQGYYVNEPVPLDEYLAGLKTEASAGTGW